MSNYLIFAKLWTYLGNWFYTFEEIVILLNGQILIKHYSHLVTLLFLLDWHIEWSDRRTEWLCRSKINTPSPLQHSIRKRSDVLTFQLLLLLMFLLQLLLWLLLLMLFLLLLLLLMLLLTLTLVLSNNCRLVCFFMLQLFCHFLTTLPITVNSVNIVVAHW